jgi:uncharacterized protein
MATQEFRAAIVDYIREQARPVDKFSHQARLYDLTREVGAGEAYDDDVVFGAVWLHDLGVFVGHRPEDPSDLARWDCVSYAMAQAPMVLKQLGFPAAKTPAVVEAIRTHQPSAQPTSIEGIILRDADILEQLGATAVLRTVSKIGRDTRFTVFPDAVRVLQRHLDELPVQLNLATSRRLAEPRVAVLRAFLEGAVREHCADLPPG